MTRQILNKINSSKHFFVMYILIGTLLTGCAIAPNPEIDVFIEPVEGQTDTKIDPQTGAVTMQKNGVAVTLEPLDEIEMYSLTDDPHINPYLVVENNGNVEPIYTVFLMTVHNLTTPRVVVEESAQLIDRNGAQYANLPFDYFEDLYGSVTKTDQNVQESRTIPHYHPYYPYYRSYLDIAALEAGQEFAAESLFESGKLFKGAKRSGLIVFDRLDRDTVDMRIIVPEISIIHSEEKHEKLKFNFDFKQVIAEN